MPRTYVFATGVNQLEIHCDAITDAFQDALNRTSHKARARFCEPIEWI